MNWIEWLLLLAALFAIFVAWDLLFCGGRRCKRFTDRPAPGEPDSHR
jgi:hypothetical protein